jgi:hypothetical protein
MAKLVWKKLKKEDLEKVRAYLDGLPEAQRPEYALRGVKRNEVLSWIIGSINKPHIVYFTKDKVTVSRRHLFSWKELERKEYSVESLEQVDIRRGVLFDSVEFVFTDGWKIRLRDVAKEQADPVERMLKEGSNAFGGDRLSDVQLTNCYEALGMLGMVDKHVLA